MRKIIFRYISILIAIFLMISPTQSHEINKENIDRVIKANKNLKLKRSKPLPNSRNSLEKTMKLKKSNII